MAAATSYPSYYDTSPIAPPSHLESAEVRGAPSRSQSERASNNLPDPTWKQFNILHHLGNLSPWRTVNFGLTGTAQVPEGCTVEQVRALRNVLSSSSR